ncbi:acid-sensing ion channel 4-A-like isoform X2 [Acipenser ruthenus]|uniref:acid-sensing ion channel 4-A-like isoform X2 n=1 Tax=Acipenser ruthenus TaxID=7906 RepID=UPI00145A3083|nr:acid-sensing ion channel 4-A-like isoform X2 [Acipenser ruthenus]
MPIEFVCKIKFAEEDEKQKGKQEGDKESLIEETCTPPTKDLAGFANSCTLHGINHIFVSGRLGIKQTLWALTFVASLALFMYQAAKCAMFYLEHPHVTALDEEASREMVFPAVTICNINRFRFSALTDADIYHLTNLTGLPPKNKDGHKATDLVYPDPNMEDIFNRTGHQMEDMLKSCNFSGENCSPKDFSVVYTRYGKCYTFNANKSLSSKKAKQGGMGNGLEIMLDIQQEEYLPIWRETNETSLEAGIRVQIHSQDEPPYIHQLGFGVSPGFQTFVSCQEQRLTYLPEPWGKCRPTAEPTIPGYNYSISACRLKCEKEEVYRKCSCRMVHVPGDEKICSPHDYTECVDNALTEIIKNTEESSTCTCETPCDLTRYGKELSMVKIPSKGSARYLSKKYKHSEEYIRDNFLVLDIFFEALNYETIEQKKAYDVAGLLGDIGGQMGLFIGASILTILEILDYIFEVARDKFHRLVKPRKDPTKEQSDSVVTLGLDNMKRPDSCETQRSHPGGEYSGTILPNHHHHHSHRGVFEDFAC